jgi:hypothetical protein
MMEDPYSEDGNLAAPKEIVDLVEKFERNFSEYKSSTYNEAQTRQEFINPFFKALGWDMDNEQGFSGAYKEVVHEASLKVGNTTKAPDYAFKIGESIKFLVLISFGTMHGMPNSQYLCSWTSKSFESMIADILQREPIMQISLCSSP